MVVKSSFVGLKIFWSIKDVTRYSDNLSQDDGGRSVGESQPLICIIRTPHPSFTAEGSKEMRASEAQAD